LIGCDARNFTSCCDAVAAVTGVTIIFSSAARLANSAARSTSPPTVRTAPSGNSGGVGATFEAAPPPRPSARRTRSITSLSASS
jgi:hypothetical protein